MMLHVVRRTSGSVLTRTLAPQCRNALRPALKQHLHPYHALAVRSVRTASALPAVGQRRRRSRVVCTARTRQLVPYSTSKENQTGKAGSGAAASDERARSLPSEAAAVSHSTGVGEGQQAEDAPGGAETVQPPADPDKVDRRVWPIAASALMMGTAMGVLLPIMPAFAREIGLSAGAYGSVVSIMGLTRLAFNIPAAWAAERFGRRPLLIGAPLVSAGAMTLTATASSLNELMTWRFMSGAAGSFQMAGSQLYLSDISTPQNRARTMAPLMAAFAAGATLGPAIGGFMAGNFGIRAPFLCVGAAFAAVVANNYFRLPETKPQRQVSLEEDVKDEGWRTTLMAEVRSTAAQWGPLLRLSDMQSVLTSHMTYWIVASGCVFTLMPMMAMDRFDMGASSIGGLFMLMSLISVLGSQPAAWCSDRWGRKKVLVPATGLLALSVAVLPFTQTVEQFIAGITVWSLGSTFLGTTPSAYVADISTEETRSQALALQRSAGDVGLMLGAGTMGLLADWASVGVAMGCASAMLVGAGLQFALRANESVNHTKREKDMGDL